jgi:hypothetical protein
MITKEEFIKLCSKIGGKLEDKDVVWLCKKEDENSYIGLTYNLTTDTFNITILKNRTIKNFGLIDPCKIDGTKVCDETGTCIVYSDKDKDITYEVQVVSGDKFEIKSAEEIDDDVGIFKFIGNCEYDKENDKFICNVYKVGSFIDAKKIYVDENIATKLIEKGLNEEVAKDISRKIKEMKLKDVKVDFIEFLNFIEHNNTNITEGLLVINKLLENDKLKRYFEELKREDVDVLLVSYEDMNRKRSILKIAQTSGNYYSGDKTIVVTVNISAPIGEDVIKETIIHEAGHALQEIKGKENIYGKLPEHIIEEQVDRFVEKMKKKL